jgi:hypothetical protein
VVTVGLSEVAANSAVAIAAVRIGRTIADVIDVLACAVVALAAELEAATVGFAAVERQLAPVLARSVERAEIVRPGVIGQIGPVVGTTPTDLVLSRLSAYGAEPARLLPNVESPRGFDPMSLEGMSMADVKKGIPADWGVAQSRSGDGEVFIDPNNSGRQIRVMPGYPANTRADPMTHGPYVVVSQNSDEIKVALAGNPTLQ